MLKRTWKTLLNSESQLSRLLFCSPFYPSDLSTELYNELRDHPELKFTSYVIDGQNVQSPRRMMWCTNDPLCVYKFSQNHIPGLPPVKFTPNIQRVVNDVERELSMKINAVLVNIYDSGKEHSDFHSDDDPWLGESFVVPSLSLGGEREFCVRPKQQRSDVTKISLPHASLVVMDGQFQSEYEHAVPITTDKVVLPRINLTFRYVVPELCHIDNPKQRWDS
jgi:alkylated DNA repair dioxygenase AlkB